MFPHSPDSLDDDRAKQIQEIEVGKEQPEEVDINSMQRQHNAHCSANKQEEGVGNPEASDLENSEPKTKVPTTSTATTTENAPIANVKYDDDETIQRSQGRSRTAWKGKFGSTHWTK